MATRKRDTGPRRGSTRCPSARATRTPKKKAAFLEALAQTASVCRACQLARLGRRTVYDWRDADPDFAKAWDAALERGTDALEDEAVRRAFQGTLKPVYQQGLRVGTIREYSDTLLIFMLKARRPHRFRERHLLEHANADGKPFVVEAPATASPEEWDQLVQAGHGGGT